MPLGCWGGALYAPLRLNRIANAFSPSASETGTSTRSRYGMISEPSTASPGVDTLTSSPGDSPAKTSVALASAPVWREIAQVCGSRCYASLARYGLRMSSRKTPRICALTDFKPCSKDFPVWGLMLGGVCLALGTSVRLIDATACGSLLPTPTGAGNEHSPSMQKWPTHRRLAAMLLTPIASDRNGDRQRGSGSLARGGGRRLTADMLPTPTATLYGSNQGGAAGRTGPKRGSLETRTGGVFIALREWMMGWPIGWTALKPLATGKFRRWLRSHGEFYPNL